MINLKAILSVGKMQSDFAIFAKILGIRTAHSTTSFRAGHIHMANTIMLDIPR